MDDPEAAGLGHLFEALGAAVRNVDEVSPR